MGIFQGTKVAKRKMKLKLFKIEMLNAFLLWQKALRPPNLHRERKRLAGGGHSKNLAQVVRKLPKKMLAEFSRLVGTLKRRIPAIDSGILFKDPTRLNTS